MRRSIFALFLLPAFAFPTCAPACEGKTVIFEDAFKDSLGGWDDVKNMRIGDGAMSITLPKGITNIKELNTSFLVRDSDICAEIQFAPEAQANPAYGIMFWALDYRHFFMFQISLSGKSALFRYATDRWVTVFSQEDASIKREPGATNTIRVVTKGQLISAYVNGTKVRDIRGQRPPSETAFGIYVQVDRSGADQPNAFSIKNYKVTSVD